MKVFFIVISIWGYNGSKWEYIGNQYVYKSPLNKVECESIVADSNWDRFETNEYYRLSVECVAEESV